MLQNPTDECGEVFAFLSQYLDGELPDEARSELEAHLAGCVSCMALASSLRTTVNLCRNYEPAEHPAPLGEEAGEQLKKAWNRTLATRNKP